MDDFLRTLLDSINETLAAVIVIVAASLLLYNLSRNLNNRIARTSAYMLGCLTVAYASDVLIALEPMLGTWESLLRVQWIGLAFIPAATFHLSDALLATTGLPSRGRRRRAVRVLYVTGSIFLLLVVFTDTVISTLTLDNAVSIRAEPGFVVYGVYFVIANGVALMNVWRARQRCLTRSTQRRMSYLLLTLLMPSIGIFPYSVLLMPGDEFSVFALFLVNIANVTVILTLLLLSYPLSFFGSRYPDRVVKAELLRFMLVGPATGALALAVIVFTEPATEIVGVIGRDFMPFAVVSVILLWQWGVDVALPHLEKWLIYKQEDDEQLNKLQHLSDRLLTRSDLLQLLEATLEATCDYLRVERAFVAVLADTTPELVQSVGRVHLAEETLSDGINTLLSHTHINEPYDLRRLAGYWTVPLYSGRITNGEGNRALIGMMGVEALSEDLELEAEARDMLRVFTRRVARTLDDMLLQSEVYAALEGLLPQMTVTRSRAAEVEYRPGYDGYTRMPSLPEREQVVEQVHAALRHWWGGPGLNSSRLLELQSVQPYIEDDDSGVVKGLRDYLLEIIEAQRPDGERDYRSPEWLFYNILTLRFIDSKKARDTARRLYISEANLYRKQNAAIEMIAEAILDRERDSLSPG